MGRQADVIEIVTTPRERTQRMGAEQIRTDMAATRAAIDRDLEAIETRVRQKRDQIKDQAITWIPMAVIGAGLAATIAFWPRRRRTRDLICTPE